VLRSLTRTALASIGLASRRERQNGDARREQARLDAAPAYACCLQTLLACRDSVDIVQVGANDGVINDPLYDFARLEKARTRLLLIEPQGRLLPRLEANYAFHANARAVCCAVGPAGSLILYGVKERYWDRLSIPYAEGWPDYRAPTGIVSAERRHVQVWLARHLRDGTPADEAIEAFSVQCLPLPVVLSRNGFGETVDVLQIDAEGFDDQVVYASDIVRTRPTLIHFEAMHLEAERYAALKRHLAGEGYRIWRQEKDALAIRRAG